MRLVCPKNYSCVTLQGRIVFFGNSKRTLYAQDQIQIVERKLSKSMFVIVNARFSTLNVHLLLQMCVYFVNSLKYNFFINIPYFSYMFRKTIRNLCLKHGKNACFLKNYGIAVFFLCSLDFTCHTGNIHTDRGKFFANIFIAAENGIGIVDHAFSFGTNRRNDHCHSCTDVRGGHFNCP